MTTRPSERFDSSPSAYAEYLSTPLGRLRSELEWRSLREQLSVGETGLRHALDLGAGTGEMALRLASLGWSVTLVDGSPRLLEHAAKAAANRGLEERIRCRVLDLETADLASALEPATYDLVLCHHVLEYLERPKVFLERSRAMLSPNGRLSLVVRNLGGEVMRCLVRGTDRDKSLEILANRTVREVLYGLDVRLFDPIGTKELLCSAGFVLTEERGIRVFADYLSDAGRDELNPERLADLECRLSRSEELRSVARYLHVMAVPASG